MARADASSTVGRATAHDSAIQHVTGQARYVDDIPVPADTLHLAIGTSSHAHARILSLDLDAVRQQEGVVDVLTADDIPGHNNVAPVLDDDPVFAEKIVEYVGQPLFAVMADSREAAHRALAHARIDYEPLDALISIEDALAADSFVLEPRILERGEPASRLKEAAHQLSGQLKIGGQEHFYLEGQAALAIPGEAGELLIHSSTQHPSEVQHLVAAALGRADHAITVEVRRMGGAFGGKETQAALFAVIAALAADRSGRAAKLVPDRDLDTIITGKRHDFLSDYRVGFDHQGRILALEVDLASRCGRSADLSGPVNDRAVFHLDNAYYLEHVRIRSLRCKTHTASNTAFRGFGGPQGMMVIERIMDHIASHLEQDPLAVRRINLYGVNDRNTTPYGMRVEHSPLPRIFEELSQSADYQRRREAVAEFNRSHDILKRGLALTPVKFGISFTTSHLNQAGALIHLYTDGSIHLNHGGTEMGQGLFIKVAQVVAEEFGIPLDWVRVSATRTDKVPNTSATAASSGSDMNGKAAQAAARTLRQRLLRFACEHFELDEDDVRFEAGQVQLGERHMGFADLVRRAWMARVPLSATGFYRTPKIGYDPASGKGRPFYYFAYGAAVSEVIIDRLTGECRVERVDILHDAGQSLNPAIDRGQIEGGFIQGMGWLTTEELHWDKQGRLTTHAPSTYKIPTAGDRPRDFRIQLLSDAPNPEASIHRSKAVGEPPLMLAISVFSALSDAVRAAAGPSAMLELQAPATPESLLRALMAQRDPEP